MEKKTVIFIGVQGSGKGTQVELLTESLTIKTSEKVLAYISGDRFRAFAKGDSFAEKKVSSLQRAGELPHSFLPIWFWTEAFMRELTNETHLIMDGSPRNLLEADALDGAFHFFERGIRDVIHLELDEDQATERLMGRGREDDMPERIKKRHAWHDSQVCPIIEQFRKNKNYRVHTIDGSQTANEVHRDIVSALEI